MKFCRSPLWLMAVLCIAMLGPGALSVFAQGSLPQAIVQAQAQLTPAECATVDAFVDAQATKLQSNDPKEVADGRSRLADKFALGSTTPFLDYYNPAVANRVTPLLTPDGPLMTRLNVAIVSAKLSGQGLVDVLQAGADDPSPAVRYWIAKAVGTAAEKKRLSTQEQKDVLVVMAKRLKTEDASLALEQVMRAISEIDLPEAIQTVLEGLDSRVSFHKKDPDARYKPVHGGMQQLWSKLVHLRSGNQNVDKDLYELARIALRYTTLIAGQLVAGDKNNDVTAKQDKVAMAGICGRVMEYAARDVANLTPPRAVDPNNAAELRVSADRWLDVLKAPPFNFTDDQLTVGE
jgi:hypothetical protein